jgi:uncharacterized damage-inducible protein DinB
MRTTLLAAVLVVATPVAALAQHQHDSRSSTAVGALGPLWQRTKDLLVKSVEQMPEAKLAFKATPDVRSFGQIVGHVINEHYIFCSAALGEKDPNTVTYENVTTRAGLLEGLRQSFTYCDPAYAMSEAKAMEQTDFFGNTGSRLWVLTFNLTHDSEHYGNLVVYFRLNGMVPPSSREGM